MNTGLSYLADVTVVGAGVTGVACALALAKACPDKKVLLLGDSFRADQVVTLTPASVAFLEGLGLEPRGLGRAVHQMEVFAANTPLVFEAADAGLAALAWVLDQSVLQSQLDHALVRSGVQRLVGTVNAMAPEPLQRRQRLSGPGFEVLTRLVVAADGGASPLRELSGIPSATYSYPQRAMVAQVAIRGLARRDTAYQWFGPHGVLAFLPMVEDRFCMIWSAPNVKAPDVTGSDRSKNSLHDILLNENLDEFTKAYQAVVGASFGEIALLTERRGFDLKRLRPKRLIADRLVLIGDAAHIIHPLAGQGLNLGLGDAQALANILGKLPMAADLGETLGLRRYERARAEPIALMSALTHGLQKVFEPTQVSGRNGNVPLKLMRLARDIGWRGVGQLAPMRQAMIRHASN